MTNKILVGVIFLSFAIGLGAIIKHQVPRDIPLCDKCNVILILVDSIGAKHLSIYNKNINTTPFLEELTEESIVFDRAYAQSPWTLPSHAALFTGEYPWTLNIWTESNVIPANTRTLASTLKEEGYYTAAFSTGLFLQPSYNFDHGFVEFHGTEERAAWNDVPKTFNDATDWLNSRPSTNEPFFLLIRSFEAHSPYGPGEGEIQIEEIVDINTRETPPTIREINKLRNLYQSDIARIDTTLRKFIAELETIGVHDNTIVIITSNHGEEFGEHGSVGFHSITLYDELIHVPLIISLPRQLKARIPYSVELRSLPSTILDLVGSRAHSVIAGDSLVPFIHKNERHDRIVFAATAISQKDPYERVLDAYKVTGIPPTVPPPTNKRFLGSYILSVVKGGWHAIQNPDGSKELYFINQDPEEQQNLMPELFSSNPVFTPEARLTIKELFETLYGFSY